MGSSMWLDERRTDPFLKLIEAVLLEVTEWTAGQGLQDDMLAAWRRG